MRYSAGEKLEIIRLVEGSEMSVKQTLKELGVSPSTFYSWYDRYLEAGYEGLSDRRRGPGKVWNKIPGRERQRVVDTALRYPEKSPRELAWYITDKRRYFISESSVYRILKAFDLISSPAYILMSASNKFKHPTRRVNEMWQTDFTYFKVVGWGWYYLTSVLDDYSRYIIAWQLCATMKADDVKSVLDIAIAKTGIHTVKIRHRPRLLSDNGPCYLAKDLAAFLKDNNINHVRGRPHHPQTQGKIERYHLSMKNVVKLQHYYFPGELENEIARFIEYYNYERYHEALENVTPAAMFYGRAKNILSEREKIKQKTLKKRKEENLKTAYNKPQEKWLTNSVTVS